MCFVNITLRDFNNKFGTKADSIQDLYIELRKMDDVVITCFACKELYINIDYEIKNMYKIKIENFYIAFSKHIYVVTKNFNDGQDKRFHYIGEILRLKRGYIVNAYGENVFVIGSPAYKNKGKLIKVMYKKTSKNQYKHK